MGQAVDYKDIIRKLREKYDNETITEKETIRHNKLLDWYRNEKESEKG